MPTTRSALRMLLIGPPGSGKGTQSARLIRDLHPTLTPISTGDHLRKHLQARTPLGLAAASEIAAGGLVSDDIVVGIVRSELRRAGGRTGWLLDGFPRTPSQAAALDAVTAQDGLAPLNLVVHLSVPDDVILDRITSRWIHAPSGRVYNSSYNPPRSPGVDDITGESLTRRPDDNPEVFAHRLEVYRNEVDALMEYYTGRRGVDVRMFEGLTSDGIYEELRAYLEQKWPQVWVGARGDARMECRRVAMEAVLGDDQGIALQHAAV